MYFPGFTADVTVNQFNSAYQETEWSNHDSSIVPQLPPVGGLVCWGDGNSFICGEGSFGGGVNPNIGAPGRCKPKCGKCINGTKTCVSVNCDADDFPC